MNSAIPQPAVRSPQLVAPLRERLFPNNEWVLIVVLLVECGIFSLTGSNFLSAANAFEITRLSVEIGLLALALTRLKFPPLIVTLGTFSLFRGVAEGLTRGIENYSGFSPQFLFLGQGYVGGLVPTQLFILIAAAAACWWWLHRTPYGRSLYAIGFSDEGARYAGIPVRKRLTLIYVLSGLA